MIALHWFWKDLIGIAATGAALFFICLVMPVLTCGKENRKAFLKEIRKESK